MRSDSKELTEAEYRQNGHRTMTEPATVREAQAVIKLEIGVSHESEALCDICGGPTVHEWSDYERQIDRHTLTATLPTYYCSDCDLATPDIHAVISFLEQATACEIPGITIPAQLFDELVLLRAHAERAEEMHMS